MLFCFCWPDRFLRESVVCVLFMFHWYVLYWRLCCPVTFVIIAEGAKSALIHLVGLLDSPNHMVVSPWKSMSVYIYTHCIWHIYIYSISCSMVMNQKLNHKLRMWYLYLYNYRYSAIWSRVHITGPPVSILGWRKECRTSDLDDDRWHFSSGFASWRDLNIQECDTNGKWYIYILYNTYIYVYTIYIYR
jgi:hypothetical protein